MVHIQVLTNNGIYSGAAVWQEVLEQNTVYTQLYELAWRLLHELENTPSDFVY